MRKMFAIAIIFVVSFAASCNATNLKGKIVTTAPSVPAEILAEQSEITITPAPVLESTYVDPAPTNNIRMYTSLADMKTFNPSNGLAQFDYWDALRGEDAINWLVKNKGYTLAEAWREVSEYSDSEFIKKNTNKRLRTIDLKAVPTYMLKFSHGYQYAPDPEQVLTSFEDLCALYETNPEIMLDAFWYQVIVGADGKVEQVRQLYHP